MNGSKQALVTILRAARRLKEIEEAKRCEDSLYEFVKAAWPHFDPSDFVGNWHLEDVCLPFGAQIITETGPRSIGDIVEKAWYGRVLSFNHESNELEWRSILAQTKSKPKDLFSVVTADGIKLTCTGNHPIFVKGSGYVPAARVRTGDVILAVPELLSPHTGQASEEVLLKAMPLRARQGDHTSREVNSLRSLWEGVLSVAVAGSRQFLQHALFWSSQDRSRKATVPSVRWSESVWQRKVLPGLLQETLSAPRTNSSMSAVWNSGLPQSCAVGGYQPTIRGILRALLPRAIRARGEQSGLYRREESRRLSAPLSTGAKEGAGARRPSLFSLLKAWMARRSSYQSRQAGQSVDQFSRPMSFVSQSSEGHTEGSYQVVESTVSAVEPEIRLPSPVYNIEVEGNNNYIADGILVHNCNHLEAVARGYINRLLINVPPRTGKTNIASICFVPWVWAQRDKGPLMGPQASFFYASYAEQLALEHSLKARRLIESKWYQKLWGSRFKLVSDRNKVSHFENDKGGYRMASSVDARSTGWGASAIFADDPHLVKEAESDVVREGVVRWWSESMPSRLNDRRTGAMVIIMQRVHEGDVAGDVLVKGGYVHICVPMCYVPCQHVNAWVGEKVQTFIGDDIENIDEDDIFWVDRRSEDGELLWPERYPASEVANLERELGPYAFASQFQQTPAPRGGGIIREEWWQTWDKETAEKNGGVPEKYPGFEYILAALDTAYTEKEENDPSALSIWGVWRDPNGNPNIFLMFCWQDRMLVHELVSRVGADCQKFKVDRLLIENKAAGHSVAQELARLFGSFDFGIELVDPRTGFIKSPDKVARLQTVVHLFAEGLIFAPDKEWVDQMIKQCALVPRAIHDDLADTCSMALIYLRRAGWAVKKEERAFEAEDETKYRPRMGSLYPV